MLTINPVKPMVTTKQPAFGAKQTGIQWDADAKSALARFDEGSGGKGKKVLGLAALLAVVAGVVLHKVPVDKLPKALAPAKELVGKLVTKLSGLVGAVKAKVQPAAEKAAEQGQKLLTSG